MRMKPRNDTPNWAPMYGKKICLEYSGIKRQCSNCYGPHAKKFCKSEKCGMESFVTGFSKRYGMVPVDLYGKLSHLARPSNSKNPLPQTAHPEQLKAQPEPTNNSQSELWTEVQSQKQSRSRPRSQPQQQPLPSHLSQTESQINSENHRN